MGGGLPRWQGQNRCGSRCKGGCFEPCFVFARKLAGLAGAPEAASLSRAGGSAHPGAGSSSAAPAPQARPAASSSAGAGALEEFQALTGACADTARRYVHLARSRGTPALEAAVNLYYDFGGDPHPPDEGVYVEAEALVDASVERRLLARLASGRRPSSVPGADAVQTCAGDFNRAKGQAKESGLWLCVNLQSPRVATCETLNKRIWTRGGGEAADLSERREALRRQTFLWQRDFDHPEAAHFRSFYLAGHSARGPNLATAPLQESACPIVCLLDPRTGRLLRRWDRDGEPFPAEAPSEAFDLFEDFIRNHTLEGHSPPESPQHSPTGSPRSSPHRSPEITCSADPSELEDEGDSDFELVGGEDLDKMPPTKAEREALRRKLPAEPTEKADPQRVWLAVKLPSGKRLARAFRAEDSVEHVFNFVDAEWEDWQPYSLAVSDPPQKRLLERPRAAEAGTLAANGMKHQSLLWVEPLD
mmetsp:Transcript_39821/g.103053  ORF Transcript_39821/g.103053 Transcript_39821/m.103053 type:complete len:475 (-) Transcript_39821:47-1471(-)